MNSEKKFKKYLDDFEKNGRFLECSKIEDNHGSLLLKYNDKIICDTSQCGNLVNPHQCNDMNFLRFAFEIVRMAFDITFKKRYNKSKLKELVEDVGEIEEQYPITPGKWIVMFEYNGYNQLYSNINSAEICHNRSNNTGYLYWMFAKCPELYKNLQGFQSWQYNNLNTIMIKSIIHEMIEDYNRYFAEENNDS